MSVREAADLLRDVRADYLAMARDLHALKKAKWEFSAEKLPLVGRMDEAIKQLDSQRQRP